MINTRLTKDKKQKENSIAYLLMTHLQPGNSPPILSSLLPLTIICLFLLLPNPPLPFILCSTPIPSTIPISLSLSLSYFCHNLVIVYQKEYQYQNQNQKWLRSRNSSHSSTGAYTYYSCARRTLYNA